MWLCQTWNGVLVFFLIIIQSCINSLRLYFVLVHLLKSYQKSIEACGCKVTKCEDVQVRRLPLQSMVSSVDVVTDGAFSHRKLFECLASSVFSCLTTEHVFWHTLKCPDFVFPMFKTLAICVSLPEYDPKLICNNYFICYGYPFLSFTCFPLDATHFLKTITTPRTKKTLIFLWKFIFILQMANSCRRVLINLY